MWSYKTTFAANNEEVATSRTAPPLTRYDKEPTKPRSTRGFFGLGKSGRNKEEAAGSSANTKEPDWATVIQEDEARGDDNEIEKKKQKRRLLLLQRALSAEKEVEDGDDGERQPRDGIEQTKDGEEIKSLGTTGSTFSSFLQNPRQTRVVFRQFGSDPKEGMKVEQSEDVPTPAAPDHVLVRVQVS